MCQRVGRELISAIEDIIGYKVVRWNNVSLGYMSEWRPSKRGLIDPDSGNVVYNAGGENLGSDITYRVGETVHSPGGPGIFFYRDPVAVSYYQALLKVRVPAGTKYRLCSTACDGPLGDCFAAETIVVKKIMRRK